jgi:hypothetical protein
MGNKAVEWLTEKIYPNWARQTKTVNLIFESKFKQILPLKIHKRNMAMQKQWLNPCPSGQIPHQICLINFAHLESIFGQIQMGNMESILGAKIIGDGIGECG